jgi:hypothetical protein
MIASMFWSRHADINYIFNTLKVKMYGAYGQLKAQEIYQKKPSTTEVG